MRTLATFHYVVSVRFFFAFFLLFFKLCVGLTP